ncbi:LPS-assembly protein LptD [Rhodophyticola sp. SM2404]
MRDFSLLAILPRRGRFSGLIAAILTLCSLAANTTQPLHAQEAEFFPGSVLVADEIAFDNATELLTARGNVEVFQQGNQLQASAVTYDGASDLITVEGPLILTSADGSSVLYGDFAELSTDMQRGMLLSARQVMEDSLQIAATEFIRTGGRYNEAYQARASYCQVCANNPRPLWEIRARRIVHDQEARMIYFENAQFRLADVPIAYIPRLRMPGPGVERATGFLPPTLRSSTLIGTSLRMPYFITLGDHADLTLTPVLSFGSAGDGLSTLEARYRQAFSNGYVELNGAFSRDDLTPESNRSFLFANGGFQFDNGFDLGFQLQTASDRSYLSTYNFFDGETRTFMDDPLSFDSAKLTSRLSLSRLRTDEVISLNYTRLQNLLASNASLDYPNRVFEGEWARWFELGDLPGRFTFDLVGQADYNEFGPTNARQRDVGRVFGGLGWANTFDLGAGFELDTETAVFGDRYRIMDDRAFPQEQDAISRYGMVALRWPQSITGAGGITHDFEPFIRQIVFNTEAMQIPSIDGTIDNFDPNSRFGLSRFRRFDRNTDLNSTEIGVNYRASFANGWYLGGGVERDFLHDTAPGAFTGGELYRFDAGYTGERLAFGLSQTLNSVGEPVLDVASLSWSGSDVTLSASYRSVEIDADYGSTSATDILNANLSVTPHEHLSLSTGIIRDNISTTASFVTGAINYNNLVDWSSSLTWAYSLDSSEFDTRGFNLTHTTDWGGAISLLYDFDRDEARRIGLGLNYLNECMRVSSLLSRRDSVVSNVDAATEFSLRVEFGGFSGQSRRQAAGGRCGV